MNACMCLHLTNVLPVFFCFQNYAKKLVIADRASLFLLDTKSRELYARIFDTGRVEEHIPQKEIR